MKTVRNRLFVLLLLMGGIFLIAVVLVRKSEQSPVLLLQSDSEQRSSNLLKRVLDDNQERLATYVYDYSLWDEMVDCIKKRDLTWGDRYVLISLTTFHNDVAWISDTSFRVIYSTDVIPGEDHLPLPVPIDNPKQIFSKGLFPTYFYVIDTSILEVSVAPVQPADDTLRSSPPRGYYFVGRLWTEDVIDAMSMYSEATVTVASLDDTSQWVSEPGYGILRFSDTLRDWQGKPLRLVRGEGFSKPLMDLYHSAIRRVWILGVLAGLLIGVWWFCLTFWVTRPMRSISRALEEESAEPIEQLLGKRNEFGAVASMISKFFQQRGDLIAEVEERRKAEELLSGWNKQIGSLAESRGISLKSSSKSNTAEKGSSIPTS